MGFLNFRLISTKNINMTELSIGGRNAFRVAELAACIVTVLNRADRGKVEFFLNNAMYSVLIVAFA